MGLVEIVRGLRTAEPTLDAVRELVRQLGKTAVEVKDTPGSIVNRVARPFYNEALRLLNDGVADVDDRSSRRGPAAAFGWGPLS